MNRRRFLQTTAGAAAFLATARRAYPFGQSPAGITKFVAGLPALGPSGRNSFGNYITVLSPDQKKYPGTDYYEIVAKQFQQQLHPNIPKTTFWGYADAKTLDSKYLGGVIVAKRKRPVKLKITNLLPNLHILPVDYTAIDPLVGAETGMRVDRLAVHLHGGLVHWQFDGGPFSWFSNAKNGGFVHGSSFINGAGAGAAVYDYPNNQSARLLWYHDHAYGITRLNAYAGVASAYLITDDAETELVKSNILPGLGGAFPLGIPLIIQDKTFFDPGSDPGYPVSGATKGSLWYAHTYEGPPIPDMSIPAACNGTGRWDVQGGTPPYPSLVAEFFADTMLVNGAPYPTLPVTPGRFRFRILNACQARFLNLQMYVKKDPKSYPDGLDLRETGEWDNNGNKMLAPGNALGPKMIQIGTEGGFLPQPVVLNDPPKPIGFNHLADFPDDPTAGNVNRYNLLLAPAERADIIVDFRGFEGKTILLYTDAPAPFPSGDIRNDYYPGGPDLSCIGGAKTPVAGEGPDTRIIMQFEVSSTGSVQELTFDQTLEALTSALPIAFSATQPPTPFTLAAPLFKTLNEDHDDYGRLRQRIGSPDVSSYLDAPDTAHKGQTRIWKIVNLTGDTHPMHFHLVNVQIIKRETWQFDGSGNPLPGFPAVPGTARLADPNERGWKETVRMNPGEIITVIMKFDLPPGAVTPSPRLQASYGINAAEYVWHCHILEHEEHDMMHALVVA